MVQDCLALVQHNEVRQLFDPVRPTDALQHTLQRDRQIVHVSFVGLLIVVCGQFSTCPQILPVRGNHAQNYLTFRAVLRVWPAIERFYETHQ